jgi:fibronectin type 3 domain-containing protein
MSGCAHKTVTSEPPKVQATLPTVTSIKTLSTMTTVGFEWKMIPSTEIAGYRLYRVEVHSTDKKLKRVAQIDDRYSSHYVDTKLKPGTEYIYQMSTFNDKGFESRQSRAVRVKTKPMIESVSFVRAITDLPKRIKLIWRPHHNPRVVGYVIERARVTEPDKWKKIADVPYRLSAEYIDKDLGDGEVYIYRVRVKLSNSLVSKPSTAVKAITKPLPKPPVELVASNNLPRTIHLEWIASPTPDVVYYKVYRSPFSMGFYSYHAKTDTTFFDDRIEEDGKSYYYKVSAVDKDGLESPIAEVPTMGSTLVKPEPPTITTAKVAFNHAIITWKAGDERADHYEVIRTHWEGLRKKKRVFKNIYETKFVDKLMQRGIKYTYRVVAIDKDGLRSEPSESIDLYIAKEE